MFSGSMEKRDRPADVIEAIEIDYGGIRKEIGAIGGQGSRADHPELLGVGKDHAYGRSGRQLIDCHENGDDRSSVVDRTGGVVIHAILENDHQTDH